MKKQIKLLATIVNFAFFKNVLKDWVLLVQLLPNKEKTWGKYSKNNTENKLAVYPKTRGNVTRINLTKKIV